MAQVLKVFFMFGLACSLSQCQILEECRTDSYPPNEDDSISTQIVNLDLPPKERWTHVVVPRKQHIENFILYLQTLIPASLFNMITEFLSRGIKKFPKPYNEEIVGIAEQLELPLGHMLACNIFYELEKVCTSIVAQDEDGNIYHARNLDLGALLGWDKKNDTWKIAELLRPLTVAIDFQSKGKTLFKTVQFSGTVGVFTGVSPGKFSFSLNSRSPNHFLGGPLSVLSWLLSSSNHARFASILARDVLQNAQSFEEASSTLTNTPLLAPVYYILAGTKPNQGVVITRSSTSSIKPMKLSGENWFLVQTNYDNWKNPPFYDNRRLPASKCMRKLKKMTNEKENYFQIIYNTLSTIPVRNKATIYTALMSPNTGQLLTYKRSCSGDCYPW